MARVTGSEFKFFYCPFCGELVQPVACGWRLGKMKCPRCRKKCYRQTFGSNCPVGNLCVEEDDGFQEAEFQQKERKEVVITGAGAGDGLV